MRRKHIIFTIIFLIMGIVSGLIYVRSVSNEIKVLENREKLVASKLSQLRQEVIRTPPTRLSETSGKAELLRSIKEAEGLALEDLSLNFASTEDYLETTQQVETQQPEIDVPLTFALIGAIGTLSNIMLDWREEFGENKKLRLELAQLRDRCKDMGT